MSTIRIPGPTQYVDLDFNPRLSGAQRMEGLARAGQAFGASAAQAVGAMATLPLLPTGAPLWLGLRAVSNLRAGLWGLGYAAVGAPAPGDAVSGTHLAALCTDVLRMVDAGTSRRGCEAAAELLCMESVELGAWRFEVIAAFQGGVERVVADAIDRARVAHHQHAAQQILWDASDWVRRVDHMIDGRVSPAVRVHAMRRLDTALAVERWWWRVEGLYNQSLDAEARGDLAQALVLLDSALKDAHEDMDVSRAEPLREKQAHLRLACVEQWSASMRAAVDAEDWRSAQRAAETLLTFTSTSEAFAPEADAARAVRTQARALVGEAAPTFDALEQVAKRLRLDAPWRMKQINEARILLGPADGAGFATLADEIIATYQPPPDVSNPRIIHPRLPNLFYHPERNRHGPYIKMVPQAMLAAFAHARHCDSENGSMSAQRDFLTNAFTDLCFEGRADAMMDYLARHPLEDASFADNETVLDVRSDMADEARVCEHFRVFNVVQLRRFAMAQGINVHDHVAFSAARPALEASAAYERNHCNAERFARYLAAQDFVHERADRDAYVARMVDYMRDVVGVL